MSAISALFTKPWFVVSVVFGCFAVITPRILVPMFKQLLGLSEPAEPSISSASSNSFDRRGPPVVPKAEGSGGDRHRGPSMMHQPDQDGGGASASFGRSVLVFILPIYAIGIAGYMAYTLFKVYSKKSSSSQEETGHRQHQQQQGTSVDDYSNYNFNDIKWDPLNKKFVTENEFMPENEYTNLDEDYVQFLKQKRRRQADEGAKVAAEKTGDLNNVLSVMKVSLNNINKKLVDAEKKGGPMDDTDLQNLRLQLANTELQMVKILQAMDSMSTETAQKTCSSHDEADGNVLPKRTRGKHALLKTRRKHSIESSASSSPSLTTESSSTAASDANEATSNKKTKNRRKKKKNKNRTATRTQKAKQVSTSSSELDDDNNKKFAKKSSDDDEENEL